MWLLNFRIVGMARDGPDDPVWLLYLGPRVAESLIPDPAKPPP